MRFFGLKSCDTCRKALRDLAARGILPQVIDVRDNGISKEDLAQIAGALGDRAVNRASTTWRTLDDRTRTLAVADLLEAHPTVMKRPVIEADGVWHVGWKADVQAAVLG